MSAKIRPNTKLLTSQPVNQRIFSAKPQKNTVKNEMINVKTNNFFDFSGSLSNK